ncbi:MAG: uroporphyrinogen decarboxylase family protein [Bacillota bacterium]
MTPKERAVAALTLKIPDMVPTFELEFQLEEEMFGKKFLRQENLAYKSEKERKRLIAENAEYMVEVYEKLEYSIIPVHYLDGEGILELARQIRKLVGDRFMLAAHGDGTFAIPDGNDMFEFAYAIADDPEGMKEKAKKMADEAIERNKALANSGIDCLILCADYCYNSGPFISPKMFGDFIQPYLYKIIDEARKQGLYTIKHTDGNIMPILDQLVECRPHAIHSLDPMANVDIREVKRLVGSKVCLCGNVNCALMQTGTDQEVIESAKYCLTYGKPGGGYIFSTSNVPFKGLAWKRYKLILDVWKQMRDY